MLSWNESRKLPKRPFNDRLREAICIGHGASFDEDWRRHRDHRDCDRGWAVHAEAGDYILVRWPDAPASMSTIFFYRLDGDVEVVAECIDDTPLELEAAVLGHGNPEKLASEQAQRSEWERKQRTALKRDPLNTIAATLPVKAYFSTPSGRVGQIVGIGAKIVSWRYLDELPAGAEPAALAGEPWQRVA